MEKEQNFSMDKVTQKKLGFVETKHDVVAFMLDSVNYTSDVDLRDVKILDPGAGKGRFTLEAIKRLYQSSQKYNFDFYQSLKSNIRAVELDESLYKELMGSMVRELNIPQEITTCIILHKDFLISDFGSEKYDIIIGNPPYVRHEDIDERKLYNQLFKTFTHRSDLYIAFYEKSLSLLKQEGVLIFICADRWLKNQYGKNLRRLVSTQYSWEEVFELHNVPNLFEGDVDAYPAITIIKNEKKVHNIPKWWYVETKQDLIDKNYRKKELRITNDFTFQTDLGYQNLCSIEELGFKIGIGIATGADKIFIISQDEAHNLDLEKSQLLPLVFNKDVQNGGITFSKKVLVSPFDRSGKLIDLSKYPKVANYYNKNFEALNKRYISKKHPHRWYSTIDKVDSGLLKRPKILVPDMKREGKFSIDRGGFYPHHNIYYITHAHNNEKLLQLLSALLQSRFVLNQMKEISVMMRGGYVRWQSQNLRKVRIPNMLHMSEEQQSKIISLWYKEKYDLMNKEIENFLQKERDASLNQKSIETKSDFIPQLQLI